MKTSSLLQRYQTALAVAFVAVFFTNIALYLFEENYWSHPPLFWIVAFAVAALPLLPARLGQMSWPLIFWCLGFAGLSAVYFFFSPPTQIVLQELRSRALSALFLFIGGLLFSGGERSQKAVRLTVWLATILATVNNVYEFFHPFFFSAINVGRPAGLYINPNQTAIVITVGTVISWPVVPRRWRLPLLMLSTLGVGLTFSRAGILAFSVAVAVLTFSSGRELFSRPQLAAMSLVVVLAIVAVRLSRTMADWFDPGLMTTNMNERIHSLGDSASGLDQSAAERVDVIRLGWDMFAAHPIVGNGLASTMSWELRASTHNMFLYLMDDHGLLGALILPLLIVVATWKSWFGEEASSPRAFALVALTWGFFSHNLLNEFHSLTGFAFVAASCWTASRVPRRLDPVSGPLASSAA